MMARLVVVALVAVALVTMSPPLKVMSVVVALDGNGSPPPPPAASVPHESTPNWFAFTSQDAAFKLETMRPVVEARPLTLRFVVVAFVVVVFAKILFPVHVLSA